MKWLFDISLEEANQSQKQIFQSLPAWSDLTFLTQRTCQYIFLYQLEVSRFLLGLRNDGFWLAVLGQIWQKGWETISWEESV